MKKGLIIALGLMSLSASALADVYLNGGDTITVSCANSYSPAPAPVCPPPVIPSCPAPQVVYMKVSDAKGYPNTSCVQSLPTTDPRNMVNNYLGNCAHKDTHELAGCDANKLLNSQLDANCMNIMRSKLTAAPHPDQEQRMEQVCSVDAYHCYNRIND